MNKAFFLDRDGTINVDKSYVHKKENFEFIPGSVKALKNLTATDYKIIIITNQSGIGRGYYTEEDYHRLNEHMLSLLADEGIRIDAIYFCPHHAEKGVGEYKKVCECRKPKTGMIDQAVREHNIDPTQSYMIGDKTADIEMGRRAGCKTGLVKTGKAGEDRQFDINPDIVGENLEKVVEAALEND